MSYQSVTVVVVQDKQTGMITISARCTRRLFLRRKMMRSWASGAWNLKPANENDPIELIEKGTASGGSLELDIDSFDDFSSSNIANLQKGRSSRYGEVVVKCVRASHRQPPHDVRNEACLLARLSHKNVRSHASRL